MTNIIKRIRTILGRHEPNIFSIVIHPSDEVVFSIYEVEIPIVVSLRDKQVFVDSGSMTTQLTCEMLKELGDICSMLEKNLDVIKDVLN